MTTPGGPKRPIPGRAPVARHPAPAKGPVRPAAGKPAVRAAVPAAPVRHPAAPAKAHLPAKAHAQPPHHKPHAPAHPPKQHVEEPEQDPPPEQLVQRSEMALELMQDLCVFREKGMTPQFSVRALIAKICKADPDSKEMGKELIRICEEIEYGDDEETMRFWMVTAMLIHISEGGIDSLEKAAEDQELMNVVLAAYDMVASGELNASAEEAAADAGPPKGGTPNEEAVSVEPTSAELQQEATDHAALAMESNAEGCVEYVQQNFGIALDYTGASIPELEDVLTKIDDAICHKRTNKFQLNMLLEQSDAIEMMFGGYLGETLRREVGGRWEHEQAPGSLEFRRALTVNVLAKNKEVRIKLYPCEKVKKRMENGKDDDVSFYYERVVKQIDQQVKG